MNFFNKHNKFSASQKFLGDRNLPKKCSRLQNSRNFKKRFIGHFFRRNLQPASCIKIIAWAVENNYVQDHVLFFRQYTPFCETKAIYYSSLLLPSLLSCYEKSISSRLIINFRAEKLKKLGINIPETGWHCKNTKTRKNYSIITTMGY